MAKEHDPRANTDPSSLASERVGAGAGSEPDEEILEPEEGRRLPPGVLTSLLVTMTTALVFFASWIGLLGAIQIDYWFTARFISYVTKFKKTPSSDEVVIVRVPKELEGSRVGATDPELRKDFARLAKALRDAGASVIAFDFIFEEPSRTPEADVAFAEQIRRGAGSDGPTTVVVGARYGSMDAEPLVTRSSILAESLTDRNWGLIDVGLDPGSRGTTLWRILLAKNRRHEGVEFLNLLPSFPLQIFAQHRAKGRETEVLVEGSDILLRIGDEERVRVSVDSRFRTIVEMVDENVIQVYRYEKLQEDIEQERFPRTFKGKVVLIGLISDKDSRQFSDGRTRSGVDIHASVVSNLLEGVTVQPLPIPGHLASIFLLSSLGAVVRLRLAGRHRISLQRIIGDIPFIPPVLKEAKLPFALFAVLFVYLVVAVIAFRNYRVVFELTYHVLSLFATYWIVGVVTRKRASGTVKNEVAAGSPVAGTLPTAEE